MPSYMASLRLPHGVPQGLSAVRTGRPYYSMQYRVSCIEMKAFGEGWPVLQVNQKVSKTAHIKELNQEMDRLKAELLCTREKNGVYMPAELFQQREQVVCC